MRRVSIALLVAIVGVFAAVPPATEATAATTPSGSGSTSAAATTAHAGFLAGPATGTPIDIAWSYLRSHLGQYELSAADLDDVVVTDQYTDADTGVTHIYLRQRFAGIEVADGNIGINIAKDGSVMNVNSTFVGGLAGAVNTRVPKTTAEDGVTNGAAAVDLDAPEDLTVIHPSSGPASAASFEGGDLSQDPIPAKLVYVRVGETLRLAWSVRINETDGDHWWDVSTDAITGAKLASADYVDHETSTHDVYPLPLRSPNDGPRVAVANPADAVASPFGWNDTDGVAGAESTATIGNNVHAATDTDANNVADAGSEPDGGAALSFDFPVDLTQDPSTYRPFAVSNLYYWNNTIHDVLYNYGFTESAGNFQVNNYGRGGSGNDSVNAEDQDGSGRNNANFSTPPDGQAPRMQMFVWDGPTVLTVSAPAPAAGSYRAVAGQFGSISTGALGVAMPSGSSLGCNGVDFSGFPTGAIALVDRGTCSFSTKIRNAQTAGAVAVVVANNAAGAPTIMATDGTPNQPTIGAAMVSQADGITLKTNVAGMNATLEQFPDRDSSLDAEIITHEYGHGVSNRLTGGPANTACLGNAEQMGEGWSDFLALALTQADSSTVTRAVSTYSAGKPQGIRPTPYSADMSINPSTYDFIKTHTEVHDVGYVWATMLWDLYLRMVADHGFNPDVRDAANGGNNLALALVMDGLKLQPCSPGFVDGRDAILLGDAARTGGANQCAIWQVFARRGLGVGATQGQSISVVDGTQAFDIPAGVCGGAKPDLVVTGSLPATGALSTPVSASLTVTNNSTVTASAAKLAISPGTGLAVLSADPTAGTCATPTTCSLGNVAAGTSVDIALSVSPLASGAQQLRADASLAGVDASSVNDSATFDIDVYGTASPSASESSTEAQCATIDGGTINCPLTVTDTGPGANTEVFVRINHTFDGDMTISAVAPDGTVVALANGRGGSGDNFGTGPDPCSAGSTTSTTFSDSTPTPIAGGSAPFAGTYRPESALAAFDGHERSGTWNLRIFDLAPGDVGTVLCWGVRSRTVTAPTVSALAYTGATTVQYSDPASVSAQLTNSANSQGIAGETVGLAYGTQTDSATTNGTGDATKSIVITQAPGAVTAFAAFTGNHTTDVTPASASAPVVITQEDCTVAYTGDTNVSAANSTNLTAQFGESDSSPGSWAGKPIVFTVTDPSANVQTFTATTNSAGVASVTAALGPKVYAVKAAFAGDTYYTSCATPADTQVTVVPVAQTITFTSTAPSAATAGGATYMPAASATSHLPVAITVDASSAAVCSISGGVVSFLTGGTCTLDANQPGDAITAPAAQVQQSFSVARAGQTVTFTSTAPTGPIVGGPTYQATAAATSGLTAAITVDAGSTAVCAISAANVVSFLAPGTCTLNADQPGNASYSAASRVQQTFSVYDVPVFVVATPSLTGSVGVLYGAAFQASGTPAPTYSLVTGAPSWLTIDATTGALSGTPPKGTTSFTYSVKATNSVGTVTAGPFTVAVTTPPPASTKADLAVSVSCPSTGKVGVNATCTVTVKNIGPAIAKSVVVGLALPCTLLKVSNTTGGTWKRNVVSWKIASLAVNGSQAFTVTFKPLKTGKSTLGAVTASTNPDPKWTNNVAIGSITISK